MFLFSILLTVFLAQVKSQNDPVKNHTKGYCVWYDQCTSGPHAKNCLYNGPAKNLDDPEGVELLNNMCPELRGQRTCCSTKQLQAMKMNLQMLQHLTSRCPACWNNMRRLYCQLTCNKDQSVYTDPSVVLGNFIQEINYYVSPTFKQGLFDSCKDVTFPGYYDKVLTPLCGTSVEKCTPEKLLEYMGSTANGYAPFTIHFPENLVPNLAWMNIAVFKCNESFIDPQSKKMTKPCSCQDCYVPSSCPTPTPPLPPTFNPFFYRTEQLIIRPRHPVPTGYHRYPDTKWIPFGPIFHLDLLNQALDLQNDITNMKVPFGSGYITLEDICFQPSAPQSKECNIQSVFQYFQNNKAKLNKCLTSMGKICSNETLKFDFKAADFHDHILFCTRDPFGPWDEWLKEPCLGTFGGPVEPRVVLDDFGGTAYQNATTLIIKFVVNNHTDKRKLEKPLAWEKAFKEYMEKYIENPKNSNLTISFSTPRADPNESVSDGSTDSILAR